jgi:hypothetical protein
VVFAVDGLEVKVWGERDDQEVDGLSEEDSDSDESEDDSSSEEEGDQESSSDEGAEGSNTNSSERPPSSPPISSTPSSRPHRNAVISPVPSYAEEQQAFRAAERLLSRTLATADSEGHSMASEMGTSVYILLSHVHFLIVTDYTHYSAPAPTQTHILLRAPRRFVHPAWIPRQNMCITLDGMLREFLEASGVLEDQNRRDEKPKKKRAGAGVEGIWVGCRGEDGDALSRASYVYGEGAETENDEMIWWSWDGKIVGFADW